MSTTTPSSCKTVSSTEYYSPPAVIPKHSSDSRSSCIGPITSTPSSDAVAYSSPQQSIEYHHSARPKAPPKSLVEQKARRALYRYIHRVLERRTESIENLAVSSSSSSSRIVIDSSAMSSFETSNSSNSTSGYSPYHVVRRQQKIIRSSSSTATTSSGKVANSTLDSIDEENSSFSDGSTIQYWRIGVANTNDSGCEEEDEETSCLNDASLVNKLKQLSEIQQAKLANVPEKESSTNGDSFSDAYEELMRKKREQEDILRELGGSGDHRDLIAWALQGVRNYGPGGDMIDEKGCSTNGESNSSVTSEGLILMSKEIEREAESSSKEGGISPPQPLLGMKGTEEKIRMSPEEIVSSVFNELKLELEHVEIDRPPW